MTRGLVLALFAALCSLSVSRGAFAHSRPMSYSFWTVRPGGAEVKVQITTDDLALLGFDLRAIRRPRKPQALRFRRLWNYGAIEPPAPFPPLRSDCRPRNLGPSGSGT